MNGQGQKNRRFTGILAAAAALLIAAAPAAAQEAGTVSGTVTVTKASHLAELVVFVDGAKGDFKPPEKPLEIHQRGLQFHPRVLPMLKGTTVNFLNDDPILHDVYSPDEVADKLNLGAWPRGVVRTFTFTVPGSHCVLLCNVHPGMESWVVVYDHPFFSRPADNGAFTIPNVPPGKYTVGFWHPKLKGQPKPVDVAAGKTTQVDLAP